MDLKSLKYFTVVAEELNFTRAAEKLNMSQPPLSNQIKNLEEELGAVLFVRGNRSLKLTEAGKLLYQRSVVMLDMAERTKAEMASLKEGLSGTMYLGTVEGRAPFLAGEWIAGFHEEYPNVHFVLYNGSSDDVIDQIRRGTMELGIIAAPYDEEHLEGITVGRELWVALISTMNPLAAQEKSLTLKDLEDQQLIIPHRPSRSDAIRKWLKSGGIKPQVLCEHSNYLNALALAQANAGISIFPQTTPTVMPGIVAKTISDLPRKAEYILVWSRNRSHSELARTFIEFVQDYITMHPEAEGNEYIDAQLL